MAHPHYVILLRLQNLIFVRYIYDVRKIMGMLLCLPSAMTFCYERFNVLLWVILHFTHILLIPCSYLAHVALMSLSCRSLYALYTNYTILLAWPIYSRICKPRHSVRMVRMCFIKQELEQEKTRCMSTGTFRFRDQMIKKP